MQTSAAIPSLKKILENSVCESRSGLTASARAEAFASFERQGFPSRANSFELWKYASLKRVNESVFESPMPLETSSLDVARTSILKLKIPDSRVVFLDGVYVESLSSSPVDGLQIFSVEATSLPANLEREWKKSVSLEQNKSALENLSLSLFTGGVLIHVPEDKLCADPFYFVFLSSGRAVARSTRAMVYLERGAKAEIVEVHAPLEIGSTSASSANVSLSTSTLDLVISKNANLAYRMFSAQASDRHAIMHTRVQLSEGANLDSVSMTLGGALTRHELSVNLNAANASAQLIGLYVAQGKDVHDHHTTLLHASPNTQSRQIYKGILADESRGIFNGKIVIEKDAQKSDSELLNKNLILSRRAEVDTKPELEIYANDVKATHGATIGQLNEDELFYLESRAIERSQALQMLAQGFAEDVMLKIKSQTVRELALALLGQELDRISAANLFTRPSTSGKAP